MDVLFILSFTIAFLSLLVKVNLQLRLFYEQDGVSWPGIVRAYLNASHWYKLMAVIPFPILRQGGNRKSRRLLLIVSVIALVSLSIMAISAMAA